jgi:Holliday junction DNA helicase RuvA
MFNQISGKIISITPTSLQIENHGLGYQIFISLNTYTRVKDLKEARIFTYCIIKNESQAVSGFAIYGFAEESEKNLFMDLISVSGVGNNTAQLILSSFEPDVLSQVIASGDALSLQKVKGIGAKTAQRVIIDLKDKFLRGAGDMKFPVHKGNTIREESLSALLTLGFGRSLAEKAIDRAIREKQGDDTVEKLIKSALGFLSS